MTKKILSMFFSLLIMLSMLPADVFAEGFEYNFAGGSPYCGSLIMMNMDTGAVVYSNNADEQRPMASLTKIMTYIVTVETIPDLNNTRITVPQSVADDLADTGSSLADIVVGEEFSVFELLHMMMIPSGNDAAATLAAYIDSLQITVGSLESNEEIESQYEVIEEADEAETEAPPAEDPNRILTFVDLMNRKAAELGCSNTHFVNAHGLHQEGHYSTARDMLTIAEHALKLPYFSEITSKIYYDRPATDLVPNPNTLYNTNQLILQSSDLYYYQNATGIKTGSLNESGYCIVASATQTYTYVVVAMGSPYIDELGNRTDFHGEMLDSIELFNWAFSELKIKTIAENGKLMGDVALNYTWNQDRLQVVAGENIQAVLPSNVESSSIIPVLELPDSIDAPVKKGDSLGRATLTYADQVVGYVNLVAAESVERSEMMRTLEQGKAILTSTWFRFVMLGIAALVVIYLILIIISGKRRNRKRNRYHKRNM